MELRVLQYFLAVAQEQSISAAAEALHLSQPTLSTQLRALEEELGKQLLIRAEQESGHWSLRTWFERDFERLDIVSTYNLVFNASLMVEEGLGCAVAFDGLVDTGADRPLCFRPLSPRQEITPSLVWRKSAFPSRASERFLDCVREIVLEETAAPSRA